MCDCKLALQIRQRSHAESQAARNQEDGGSIDGGKKPIAMVAALAAEFGTVARVGDVAGVNQVLKRVEVIGTIEEKGPSLREKQAEGIVDIQLRAIRLHLGKNQD